MRAVLVENPGPESRLVVGEAPAPVCGPGDLRIRVAAFGVNRADLMQRRGLYPPPPGAPELLGLECAGTVAEVGAQVSGWSPGQRVMALLPGGGYAAEAVVDAGSALPVPARLSLEEAAAVPEVFLTVFLNVFVLAQLPERGALLVHGGGSGVGTAAIQLARAAGAKALTTAGSEAKCARCLELGAALALNYRELGEGGFAEAVRGATGGSGADVVLDHIGAAYLGQNLAALRTGGRLVLIGLMGGAKAQINLGLLLSRRLQLIGSTLRALRNARKAELVAGFLRRFGPALEDGGIGPVLDRVLPLQQVAEAHEDMAQSLHFGKIVVRV